MFIVGCEVFGVLIGEGMYLGVLIVWVCCCGDVVMGGCLEFLIVIGFVEGFVGVVLLKFGVGMLGKVIFVVWGVDIFLNWDWWNEGKWVVDEVVIGIEVI